MLEHLIRLRKGWELVDLDSPDHCTQRVTLPLEAGWTGARRLRLTRRFGCPPLKPGLESLWLRLESVLGLALLRLNDRDLTPGPGVQGIIDIHLAELPARSVLTLELSSAATLPDAQRGGSLACGEITLLIRLLASERTRVRIVSITPRLRTRTPSRESTANDRT
jgi:hypothetical protein